MKMPFLNFYRNFDTLAAAIFLSAMMAMTSIQIIGRLTGFQIPWTIEANRYLLIYLVFFGVSSAARVGAHIGTEFLKNFMSERKGFYIWLINQIIFLLFSVLMVHAGILMMKMHLTTEQMTASLPIKIPVAYISIILPIGFGLTALNLIFVIIDGIKTERSRRIIEDG